MLDREATQSPLNECKPTAVCSIRVWEAKGLVKALGGCRNSSGKHLEKSGEKQSYSYCEFILSAGGGG